MKKRFLILAASMIFAALPAIAQPTAQQYTCVMHPEIVMDQPGKCPKCGMTLEHNPTFREPAKIIYTGPMHPQVEQDHPGNWPNCGMTLEPKTVTAGNDDGDSAELRDMTNRFWIGAVLALPVLRGSCWSLGQKADGSRPTLSMTTA